MADDLIPKRVRKFIAENIDSIAELEALMLMLRDPNTDWTPASLAERLYVNLEQAEEAITKLCSLGIASAGDGNPVSYRFQPSTPQRDEIVRSIAETYSKYLVPVTNLIHSKPESRVQQFADAFKLKKGRDE